MTAELIINLPCYDVWIVLVMFSHFFGYDFFKNEFAGSVFLSGEIIRSAQAELKNSESDLKISENVKNGLKRL